MNKSQRKGLVIVAMVIILMMLSLIVMTMVWGVSKDSHLMVKRLDTLQAFYAAEGGMNCAIRELMQNADEDGDGSIGGVSNDGNPANDPAIGSGRVSVEAAVGVLTSTGRSGLSYRRIQATYQ